MKEIVTSGKQLTDLEETFQYVNIISHKQKRPATADMLEVSAQNKSQR